MLPWSLSSAPRASLGDSEDDEDDEVIDIQPFVRPRQGGVCAEPWEQGYYKERRLMVMGGIWWDEEVLKRWDPDDADDPGRKGGSLVMMKGL